jgi:hypothetical protein
MCSGPTHRLKLLWWDGSGHDYVRFAAARPRLSAAMTSRVLGGAIIPAAEQAFALLMKRIAAIGAEGRLALSVELAADLVWASANAASLMHVTAQLRKTPPTPAVLEQTRESAMQAILNLETELGSR